MKKRNKQRMISIITIVCMMVTMFNRMTITVNAVTSTDVSNETELRAAIANASDGDNINVISDITVSSEMVINGKSITIEGNNHIIKVPVTGLDDSGVPNTSASTFRAFYITAPGKTVEIDNLTVKGGAKEGILNNTGTVLKLTNVNISNSNNQLGGGGIINSRGTVYIKNSNISRNAADHGGGFLNISSGKMFIENSTFSENRSTSISGGGGAGENQGYLYTNNSTFSNNKSTELGGAINNYVGTAYIVNSTFTGNVAYGSFCGGAIANNNGTVKTVNSLFAYNYRNSGTQSTPSYSLNDVDVYNGNKIDSYYCIFQDPNYTTKISTINNVGNNQYTGAANGSDNSIFTNGVNAKVLGPDGKEIGSATVFQPLLAKTGGSTTSALLQTASYVLGSGVRTSFTNGNGTPVIGYYDGIQWVSLVGTADGSYEITVDQNYATRVLPTVGSVVKTASDIYLLKVNAATGGTVNGGTIYGDAYSKDTIVNITAIPSAGYHFSQWDYVDGGTGIASTSKSFSVTVTGNITLKPVFTAIPNATFAADITTPTNKDVNVTINYPSGSVVNQYSLDGTNYSPYTAPIALHENGKIYAKSQDADGCWSNISQYNVTNIDKTLPIFSVSGNPTTWTSSDVTLSISASDVGFGLNTGGAYSFDGGSTWITSNTKNFSSNETVNIMVRDNVGNISSQNVVIDKIDKASPTFSNITKTPSAWTGDSVTLIVNGATDNGGSGLNSTAYSFSTAQGVYNWQSSNVSSSFTQNQDIYVYIRDALGNISNASTVNITNIDNTLPLITSVTGNPTDWTSNSVTLTVNANDEVSDLAAEAYSFDGGATWQAGNTRTYDANVDGVAVEVKDNAGNIAAYGPINITKIDKTSPNTPAIANKDSYTENKWFNKSQTITASFAATDGCDEKLQYKVDDSAWTDGESAAISDEGKYDVSFRVIDGLGRASAVQTVKVNVDKTAPVNAKITVKDREFTSILNTITFDIFFKDTVNVSITSDDNISGIKKIEYQKVAKDTDYSASGTWTSGSSFNVAPDDKFIVYARITDNAGNYVVVNSDGVIVDATKPALTLTPDTNNWTKNNVNVKVEASDELAGVKEVTYTTDESAPQTGTVSIVNGQGTITLTNEGQYKLTVTAKDNSLNEISESTNIKIDRTKPIITGASNSSSYFIGRVINLTDDIGEIAEATFKNGTDTATSFKDGTLFEKPGNYTLTLVDRAGNSNTLSFEIKALPKVEDVVYTTDYKVLIESIRDEFRSHNDLPEPYKTDMDNEIKALEARYSQLVTVLYDANNDLTVMGIDGTFFTPNVYLVVTPINGGTNEAKLRSVSKDVENASKYISKIEGKELLALYDVSLFRDKIKIQPDGNVKVKIKIPKELRNRTGFDIVHIADNGTVTPINATVEGDYLVFTTTHFSEYAIVAKSIIKEMPKTGSIVDFNSLIIVGILLNLIGIVLIRKKVERIKRA